MRVSVDGAENAVRAGEDVAGIWEEEVPSRRYGRDSPDFCIRRGEPDRVQSAAFVVTPPEVDASAATRSSIAVSVNGDASAV